MGYWLTTSILDALNKKVSWWFISVLHVSEYEIIHIDYVELSKTRASNMFHLELQG